jgi:pimeloyl-ACP methyl ester carboxylesterase
MSLQTLARGAIDTLDVLGERRPLHVVGSSLGGAVALQLLTLEPEQVASLVLANGAGFGSEVIWLIRMLTIPGIGSYMARHTTRDSARMAERAIYGDESLATKERIHHALAIAKQPETGPVLHELVSGLSTVRGVRRQWREDLLAEVVKYPRPALVKGFILSVPDRQFNGTALVSH